MTAGERPTPIDLRLDGVSVSIDGHAIVADATISVGAGRRVGLIGPNGSGKSTLLRVIYRSVAPSSGAVWLGDDLLSALSMRQTARRRAAVTQDGSLDADYTVQELVAMGRDPHHGMLGRLGPVDAAIVDESLAAVSLGWAAERSVLTLSGGERQRALIARALAQRAPVLLLDEPTNHLDIAARLHVLELLGALDLTVFIALHEIEHAFAYCDDVVVLDCGRVVATGPVGDILTPALISDVFGVETAVVTNPLTGRPHLVFASRPDATATARKPSNRHEEHT